MSYNDQEVITINSLEMVFVLKPQMEENLGK